MFNWLNFGVQTLANKVILVFLVSLLVLLGIQTWRLKDAQTNHANYLTSVANERAAFAAAVANRQAEFRKSELNLTTVASNIRTHTNEQVHSLTNQRDSLIRRLRNLEDTTTIQCGMSCTNTDTTDGTAIPRSNGAEFLGSLGEEDVHEANRADTIRLHLEACYTQYNRAQEALKEFNK